MHPTEGEIRAYQDQELDPSRSAQVKAHLASCAFCQEAAQTLSVRAARVDSHLASLRANAARRPVSADTARLRLENRIHQKEERNMFKKLFPANTRPIWVMAAVVMLLVVSLAFPPVRAIATSFLGLFRIERISAVPVNPGDLPEQLGSSSLFETMIAEDVQFEEFTEHQEVGSLVEASELSGMAVRLPASMKAEPALAVQPDGRMTVRVNLPQVRALLDEIGRSDIELPAELDGAVVTVDIPKGVTAQYGACEQAPERRRGHGYDPDDPGSAILVDCTTLLQMRSPEVNAPPDLDIRQIGEAYLQVMGMTQEEAEQFSQTVDWTTTFIIPIPQYSATYADVLVDGVNGILIERPPEDRREGYMLIWIKDGVLYTLAGPEDGSTGLAIANSLQ